MLAANFMTPLLSKIETVKSVVQNQLDDIKRLSGINSLILSVCLVDTLAGFFCGYTGQKKGTKSATYNLLKGIYNHTRIIYMKFVAI